MESKGHNTDLEAKEESHGQKDDADSGNDGSSNEMLQKENLIDPGNEHHHLTDADYKLFDKDVDRSPRFETDSGGDASGTVGPEPGEAGNDEPDTSGKTGK